MSFNMAAEDATKAPCSVLSMHDTARLRKTPSTLRGVATCARLRWPSGALAKVVHCPFSTAVLTAIDGTVKRTNI